MPITYEQVMEQKKARIAKETKEKELKQWNKMSDYQQALTRIQIGNEPTVTDSALVDQKLGGMSPYEPGYKLKQRKKEKADTKQEELAKEKAKEKKEKAKEKKKTEKEEKRISDLKKRFLANEKWFKEKTVSANEYDDESGKTVTRPISGVTPHEFALMKKQLESLLDELKDVNNVYPADTLTNEKKTNSADPWGLNE